MKKSRYFLLGFASLLLIPFTALAVTDTWDGNLGAGANNNISNNLNWLDDTAPLSDLVNTDLVFATANKPTPNVSVAFETHSITFDPTATSFAFGGLAFKIGTGGILNSDNNVMTFNNAVDFSGVANSTITATNGPLFFFGGVTLPTGTLTVSGPFLTEFLDISGTSGLTKTGSGEMIWEPSSTVDLDFTLSNGTLTIGSDGTVDVFSSTSSIAVSATSVLNLQENVTLDGAQITRAAGGQLNLTAGKTLTLQNSADVTITGAFSNNTASVIQLSGPGVTFSTTGNFGTIGGATLNVLAGASASSSAGAVNVGTNGNGSVTVGGSGSSLGGGDLNLGLAGATAFLAFNNSSSGTFSNLKIDVSPDASTSGTLNIQSGALVTSSGLSIATTAAANTGTVTITGTNSRLTLNGAANVDIGATSLSTGSLNVNSLGIFNGTTGTTTVHQTGAVSISSATYNANGDFTIDGGLLTLSGGNFNLAAAKTLTVQNGGDFNVTNPPATYILPAVIVTGSGSTFTTTASLLVGNFSTFDVLSGADVSASGSLLLGTFGDGTMTVDGAGSSLTSASAIIGQGGLDGFLTFKNGSTGSLGAIQLDEGTAPNGSGIFFIQTGAQVTGTSLTMSDDGGINHASNLNVSSAGSSFTLTGAATATLGAASGSPATLRALSSGTFNSGTGLTTVNATGTIEITGGVYTSHGNLTLNGGQLTRDAAGVFGIDAGKTLTVQAGGDAVFTGPYSDATASTILVTGSGSTLTSTQGIGIEAGAALSVTSGGSVSGTAFNIGTTGGDGSSVVVNGVGSSLTANFTNMAVGGNTGSLAFLNGSTGSVGGLTMATSNTASSDATFNIESGASVTATALFVSQLPAANIGTVTITGAGSKLTLTGVNTSLIGASSASSGLVIVESGATLTTGTSAINIGNTGEIDILPGGTLNGPADFGGSGPINIAGNYSPGTASGANQTTDVTFAQNMIFQSSTNLTMELGGTTPGTQHDKLIFNGAGTPHLTWNGTLTVLLINGFVPQVGNLFDLFDFDLTRDSGAFTTINLPALTTGLFWRLDQLYSPGRIYVGVTADNYAQWQSAYGSGAFDADDDKDGVPNGIEFLLGTNPTVAFAPGQYPLTELPPVSGANTTASFSFKIPSAASSDAIYRVRASPDLITWTTIASKIGGGAWSGSATVATGSVVAGYTNITVSETLPLGTARRFHRLEAVRPP